MKKFFAFVTVALMSISMFAENITVAQAIEIGKNWQLRQKQRRSIPWKDMLEKRILSILP